MEPVAEELMDGSTDNAEELTINSADDVETLRKIGSTVYELDGSSDIEDPDVASVEYTELVITV